MTVKINPFLLTAILIGIGILIITLVRGCHNEKKLASVNIDYEGQISQLKKNAIEDLKQLSAYKDTMQFMDGQLSLSKNKELSLNEDLGKANDRITLLLRKHVPIKPSPSDTGIITVPMRFVNECADCFTELGNGQQLVKKYKAEKDTQEVIYKGKLKVKDNRINYLEKSNADLTLDYKSLIDSTKKVQDVFKPRGRLYLSWGVLWSYFPSAAGFGLKYQTKRNLLIGVMGYYGTNKTTVETTINFPLSFKRK